MNKISKIKARQVFDSRGNPTIEAEVYINNISASASSDNPWFLNNIYLILGWVLFWPVGAYGSYKRYQHNKELTN